MIAHAGLLSLSHFQAGVTGRRRRLMAEAEGEGAAAAQPPSAAGRRRRRLAAAEGGEGEAGEGATASKPSATDRVGCFPPFTKWQDFEVWLALTNKGALPCSKRGGLAQGPSFETGKASLISANTCGGNATWVLKASIWATLLSRPSASLRLI